ncbi:hypothetical protein IHE44_0008727 [Lamprotornis superbus]|uniref:Uncharacterized protein n=1 Tax=Lamprotornis superbus TaxID=245042 RepID=A0A835NDR6_9PASS|nr:hypothetical protein IHE44_0008727 [Lamprotornis superbus]
MREQVQCTAIAHTTERPTARAAVDSILKLCLARPQLFNPLFTLRAQDRWGHSHVSVWQQDEPWLLSEDKESPWLHVQGEV